MIQKSTSPKNEKSSFRNLIIFSILLMLFGFQHITTAQGIYTARGYWEETNKSTYKTIKKKQNVGDPVTDEEMSYLLDFEDFLNSYYQKLSENERNLYEKMRNQWDREVSQPNSVQQTPAEFEWRGIDRVIATTYGIYYGASLVSVLELDNFGVLGIPLMTGGMWALGPVINPKKFEDIDRSVIRANNAGRFLGLIYGGSLGLVIGGNTYNEGKTAFAFSTVGSIALGEVAFQMQKKRRYSEGHIEVMRHHGVLGSFVGISTISALNSDNGRIYGLGALVGGATGLALGNIASKKYPYSKGDGNYITNMSIIGTGIGFAIATQATFDNNSSGVILIPAAFSVIGTSIGQKTVKGVNLTNKQGSTINYATGGAALVGLGVAALAESGSPAVVIGLPSGFALITQQILFSKYKKENMNFDLSGKNKEESINYSLKFNPENYFVNQQLQAKATIFSSYSQLSAPIVNFKLNF